MARLAPAFAAVCTITALAACARTLPPDASSANLYRDLRRLVTIAETTGWRVDRDEVHKIMPRAMMSLCRVAPAERERLGPWLEQRISQLGGPPEKAWRARGKRLAKISDLLVEHRIRLVYKQALLDAKQDCPFYIEPQRPYFRGRQIADNRFLFSFGAGGKAIGINQAGRNDISFGGAARALFGRSFGTRLTLMTGFEFGGSAAFPRNPDGGRSSLIIAFDSMVPLVSRIRLTNAYVELEAGYLFRFTEDDGTLQPGMHVGLAFGARVSRQPWLFPGGFFPGAVFGVAFERIFMRDGGDALNMIKIGFRAAFDIHF
ncbi:MAG: hypothetical protein KC503_17955 [Myxococcales bacterium]|nr:hypothetical protein [Myxococcales bacterium]